MNNEEVAEAKLEKIANTSDLEIAIKRLERKKMLLETELQDQMHVILESIKPTNILKTTIHEVQESTELKHNLFKVALGLGAGYFSRKLVVGKSAGLVKKALGTALQYGITQFVAKKNNDNADNNQPHKKKNLLKRILSI
ncbi:MAG: hypothetical protein M3Z92_10200 [Bacteroidota bacterium]|nr:hypothetical protein [Bacteroidota bacterium]